MATRRRSSRELVAQVEELDIRGSLLGVVEEPALAEIEVELAVGDLLVFVTDGVEETQGADRTIYGHERWRKVVGRAMEASGRLTNRGSQESSTPLTGTSMPSADATRRAMT